MPETENQQVPGAGRGHKRPRDTAGRPSAHSFPPSHRRLQDFLTGALPRAFHGVSAPARRAVLRNTHLQRLRERVLPRQVCGRVRLQTMASKWHEWEKARRIINAFPSFPPVYFTPSLMHQLLMRHLAGEVFYPAVARQDPLSHSPADEPTPRPLEERELAGKWRGGG